ncbi:lactose-binding lectin l-2-like [Gouania willdenowi]|uniref:Lactose-binding lectin l-2-like n=1 Tax=Gouania willdenowi TaxID=441366 RepID=A0A8C5HNC4_GOUWI|nr:lactose-binding lectin l-2-like [Gouania willdenowi]
MAVLFLLLFSLCLADVSPSEHEQEVQLRRGKCSMYWFAFRSRCYKYIATAMSWADAELQCLSEGANLASIHSLEEHAFVNSLIKNLDPAQEHTWIGLSDNHKDERWMWSDGSKVNFVYWETVEPRNDDDGLQHCVHTNWGSEWKWKHSMCFNLLPFVCASRTACP